MHLCMRQSVAQSGRQWAENGQPQIFTVSFLSLLIFYFSYQTGWLWFSPTSYDFVQGVLHMIVDPTYVNVVWALFGFQAPERDRGWVRPVLCNLVSALTWNWTFAHCLCFVFLFKFVHQTGRQLWDRKHTWRPIYSPIAPYSIYYTYKVIIPIIV